MNDDIAEDFLQSWYFWARDEQRPPAGDWDTWLYLGGRGAGKTCAGAGWVADGAENRKLRRIALVGATFNDARAVMVEGESGLMAVAKGATYEPSNHRVRWSNGAVATILSAEEPDSIRGHQFDAAWGDVQAKLNKNASGDTASLLYQTSYSGRAEFGLTGDDDFHCKVSPDGSSWTDALVIDRTSGALTLASGVKLPNGSAASPALALNTNSGLFYDAANSGIGLAVAGTQIGYVTSAFFRLSLVGGAPNQFNVQSENIANNQVETYNASASTAPAYTLRRGHGTIASPAVAANGDTIGNISFQPYTGASGSGFSNGARIQGVMTETATVDSTHVGMQLRMYACPIGSGTLTEVARFDNESGLSMYGANTVIDKNRGHRLRSTTIAGAVTPSAAGALFYHSDAQGGAGEVAVDTGSAYRYAGQAAVTRLASDTDATYTPRADGRIVRDSATLTANRKLTLLTTNVTDGHKVELSRRGSSSGMTRDVYQADGMTLIANIADNASADFIYDATAALWFQK